MGACRDYVSHRFGFPTETVQRTVTPGAAAGMILSNNPNRVGWLIMNLGANLAYIAPVSGVGALLGVLLNPLGDYYSSDASTDGEFPSYEQYAVSAAGTTLWIIETRAIVQEPAPIPEIAPAIPLPDEIPFQHKPG